MIRKSTASKLKVRVGSRASSLAINQVEEVFLELANQGERLDYESVTFETAGDHDKKTPLTENPADNFFTDTLDAALLAHKIDLAIHSAKDLPKLMPEGLEVFALTVSLDETDAWVGKLPLMQLPPESKVGTSSLIRQKAIKDLNPNVQTVSIRGTIDERLALVESGDLDGIIVATCALKRLGKENLIKEIMPWEASPLQGQLAVVGRSEDENLRELFVPLDIRRTYGQVVLIGAGPGDPELITVKAIKALKEADCVFYDYLIDMSLLDHAAKAEKIFVGKRKGEHTLAQSDLSVMLRQQAMAGKNVARLKSGDPLIFGRGAEEISYLRSYHIKVSVIPGISSATGIPSGLGIPLTARGISSSVAFLSGHAEDEKSSDPKPIAVPETGTIVFLMGLTKLPMIISSLKAGNWKKSTPVVIISKGTRSDEKIVEGTIGDIEKKILEETIEPPALIVVGETVRFLSPAHERAKRSNDHILYLGTNPDKYRTLGNIVHVPMINISAVEPSKETVSALKRHPCEIIILTSRFAVKYFLELLQKHRSIQEIESADWVVIGQDTASALKEQNINPKLVAEVETSEGLLKSLKSTYRLKGKRILFPRSSLPNPHLKRELTRLGAKVTELTIYENTKPARRSIAFDLINKVLFTSPSTVQNFLANYGVIPSSWQILSKGPTTKRALKEAGYESEVLISE